MVFGFFPWKLQSGFSTLLRISKQNNPHRLFREKPYCTNASHHDIIMRSWVQLGWERELMWWTGLTFRAETCLRHTSYIRPHGWVIDELGVCQKRPGGIRQSMSSKRKVTRGVFVVVVCFFLFFSLPPPGLVTDTFKISETGRGMLKTISANCFKDGWCEAVVLDGVKGSSFLFASWAVWSFTSSHLLVLSERKQILSHISMWVRVHGVNVAYAWGRFMRVCL